MGKNATYRKRGHALSVWPLDPPYGEEWGVQAVGDSVGMQLLHDVPASAFMIWWEVSLAGDAVWTGGDTIVGHWTSAAGLEAGDYEVRARWKGPAPAFADLSAWGPPKAVTVTG